MEQLNKIDQAIAFYHQHILDKEKIKLLKHYNLKVAGYVHPVMWELMGAILTGRASAGLTGADLLGWEVKSAKAGSNFEYQYHLKSGQQKLEEDCKINHLFFSYSESYEDLTARAIQGAALANHFFLQWLPEYVKNYDPSKSAGERRQRFRKNIAFAFIEKNAKLIFKIERGQPSFRDDDALASFGVSL